MWSFGFDGEIIDNQPGLRADGRRWRISGGKVWKRAGTGFRRRRWTIVETQWRQHIQIQNIRWRWSFSWIQQAVINEFPGPGQKEGQGCQTGLQVHRQKEKRQILIKDQDCRVFFMIERDLCDQLSTVHPLSIQIHTDFFTAQFQRWPQQCDTWAARWLECWEMKNRKCWIDACFILWERLKLHILASITGPSIINLLK